ncbi:MAG: hypothetical protein NVSMB57_11480 [Actinomycetota bacterium]
MAFIIVLVVLIVAGAAYASYYFTKKRREAIAGIASSLSLSYSAGDPYGIAQTMPHQLFQLGDGRGCENVLSGTYNGAPVTEFDYWYYDRSTDAEGHTTRTYHRFSCVLTPVPVACAHLIVTGENIFKRLGEHLGFRDIEFESDEFNRMWNVKCQDRKFANDLIDQRMMTWLISAGTAWSFETVGSLLLVYSRKLKPTEIPALLECGKQFREHVPHVATDLYPLTDSAPVPGH